MKIDRDWFHLVFWCLAKGLMIMCPISWLPSSQSDGIEELSSKIIQLWFCIEANGSLSWVWHSQIWKLGLCYCILWRLFCFDPFKNETICLFQWVNHMWNAALNVLQPDKLWNVASHSITTSFSPNTHSFRKASAKLSGQDSYLLGSEFGVL